MDFGSILNQIEREASSWEPESARSPASPGLVSPVEGGFVPEGLAAYGVSPRHCASPTTSLHPDEVAAELGLSRCRCRGDIQAARRRFALANHPDRAAEGARGLAQQRMQIANRLVDEALARMS